MLTAVWVAVIVAAAFWVIGVCAAVYVLLKLARLVSQTSTAVDGLRERGDLAISRADAAIDRAGDQLARTDAITASMDEVTASMADLTGRVTALVPLTRVSALVYGVRRATRLMREDRAGRRRPARRRPEARAVARALERGLPSRPPEEARR